MARDDAGNANKEAVDAGGPEPEQNRAVVRDAGGRWQQLLRVSAALHLMLAGATAIIVEAAAPAPARAPLPRLFFAFLAWLVGCLSLFAL
jgi:hypothetical protein